MVAKEAATSAELSTRSLYSDDEIEAVKSFGDAVDLANSRGGIIDGKDLGIGLEVIEDKGQLCGVEMVLLQWTFNTGDFGDFVSVTAVTKDNRKVVFNDGSTGILAQMHKISESGKTGNIYLRKGLRKSVYDNPNGEGKSTTYYLAI